MGSAGQALTSPTPTPTTPTPSWTAMWESSAHGSPPRTLPLPRASLRSPSRSWTPTSRSTELVMEVVLLLLLLRLLRLLQKPLQKHPPQKLPLQRRKLLLPKKQRLLAGDSP